MSAPQCVADRKRCPPRKFIVAAVTSVALLMMAAPAGAGPAPDGIVGTYSWHDSGTGAKVTVGYSPCGHTWTEGATTYHDPLGRFYAKAQKGGGFKYETWAHDTTSLNDSLQVVGVSLTDRARAQLAEDAATYTCSG